MRQVDERIVQMRMENGVFERAAEVTVNTLNRIKESLNFGSTGKKFADDINNAAGDVDVSKLASAVETVSNKFSTLGIIGMTALQNITNSVINTAKTMINELTIAPVSQGYNEYELKLGSVQTIMASTGATLEEVNGYLAELNTYADKTIYSFSDMTSSIGKFTNAGVDLDKAVKAIQGISNEAAVSGATAEQASHAMYNFAQALSSGYVKLIDWKSIEIANMATVEFKQQLLDSALALGTVVKEGDKYVTTTTNAKGKVSEAFDAVSMFNDSLNHQWMTTDVLVDALGRYADENTEIGKKAFAAAQDVKTFTQLMDTLKEAVGSGWAQTFELIFGDFNEAKNLWTDVNNVVGKFIDNMAQSRNTTLEFWHDNGGRKAALEGLANVFKGLQSIMEPINEAWKEMFPAITGKRLVEISKKFAEVTKQFVLNEEAASGLKSVVKLLLTPLKLAGEIAKVAAKLFGKLAGWAGRLAEGLLVLISRFVDGINKVKDFVSELKIFETFMTVWTTIVEWFGDKISDVIGKVRDFFGSFLEGTKIGELADSFGGFGDILFAVYEFIVGKFKDALTWISEFTPEDMIQGLKDMKKRAEDFIETIINLPITQDIIGGVQLAFEYATEAVLDFYGAIKKFSKSFINRIKTWFSSFEGMDFSKFTLGVEDFVQSIKDYFDSMEGMSFSEKIFKMGGDAFELAKDGFDKLIKVIEKAKESVKKFFKVLTKDRDIDFIKDDSIIGKAIPLIENFRNSVKDLGDSIDVGDKFKVFQDVFSEFVSDVVESAKGLDAGSIMLLIFSASVIYFITSVSNAFSSAGKMFKAIGTLSNTVRDFVKNLTRQKKMSDHIRNIALAIIAITGSLIVLSQIPAKDIGRATGVLVTVMAGLVAIAFFMSKVTKTDKGSNKMKDFSQSVLMLSGSLLLLSIALKLMEAVDLGPGVFDRITFLGILAAGMAAVGIIMGRFSTEISKGTLYLIGFALSVTMIVKALMSLNKANVGVLREGTIWISILMVSFAALAAASNGLKASSGFGLIMVVAAVALLNSVVKKLAKMGATWEDVERALPSIVLVVGTLVSLMLVTKAAGAHAFQGALAVIMMTATIDLLIKAMKKMAEFGKSEGDFMDLAAGIFIIFAGFSAVMAASYLAGQHAIKGGIAIVIISAATLLLAQFIKKIASIPRDEMIQAGIVVAEIGILMAGLLLSMKALDNANPKGITKLIFAVAVLMGGIAIMSQIPGDKVAAAGIAIGATLLGFSSMLKHANKLNKKVSLKSMLALSVAMAGAAVALRIVGKQDWPSLIAGGIGLSITMLGIARAAKNSSTIKWKDALSMGEIAAVSVIAATALAILGKSDWKSIIAGGIGLGILMASLAKTTGIVKEISLKSFTSMAGMAVVAGLAAIPLVFLAGLPWSGMIAGAVSLGVLMYALAFATGLAQDNLKGAASMIVMSVALVGAAAALAILKDVSGEQMAVTVIALAAALTVLGIAGNALQGVEGHILLISAALLIVAAASWVFAQAVATIIAALITLRDVSVQEATNIGTALATIAISALLAMIKALPDIVKAFRDSAKMIVAGFIMGIFDGLGPLADAASFLFSVPYKIITSLWDEHSPSKVSEGLGYNVDAGFGIGLLRGVPLITQNAEVAAAASNESFVGNLSDLGAVGTDYLSTFFDSLNSGAGDMSDFGTNYGDLFSTNLGGALEGLGDMSSVLGEQFKTSFTWDPTDIYNSFYESGMSGLNGLADGGSGIPSLSADYLSEYLGNFSSNESYAAMFDFSQSGSEGFMDGFQLPDITELLTGYDLSSVMESFTTAGESGAGGWTEGFQIPDITEILTDFDVQKIFDEMFGAGEQGGEQYTAGVKSGIEKGQGEVEEAGTETSQTFNESLANSGIAKPIIELSQIWNKTKRPLKDGASTAAKVGALAFTNNFGDSLNAREFTKKQVGLMNDGLSGSEAITKFKKSGSDDRYKFLEGFVENMPENERTAASLAFALLTGLTGTSGQFTKTGFNFAQNVAAGMGLNIYQVANIGAGLATAGLEPIEKGTINGRDAGVLLGQLYGEGIWSTEGITRSTAIALSEVGVGVLDSYYQNFYNTGASSGSAAASGLASNSQGMYNAGYAIANSANSAMANTLSDTASIGINAGAGLVNGLNAKEREVSEAAQKLASAAAVAMEAALQIASPSKKTEEIGENTADGYEEGLNKASNKVANQALNFGAELAKKTEQGIEKGTNKVKKTASNAGGKLGGAAINGLNKNLMINSPSKAGEQSGEWLAVGFARGIQNMTDYIENKSGNAGDAAMSGLQSAIKLANEVFEADVDTAPVIRPVIDLSNVSTSAEQINQILNGKTLHLSSFTLDNVNATARAMNGFKEAGNLTANYDDTNVIQAIKDLGTDISTLKESIAGMNVMLNGTALVGQILPDVDRGLARRQTQYRRGN